MSDKDEGGDEFFESTISPREYKVDSRRGLPVLRAGSEGSRSASASSLTGSTSRAGTPSPGAAAAGEGEGGGGNSAEASTSASPSETQNLGPRSPHTRHLSHEDSTFSFMMRSASFNSLNRPSLNLRKSKQPPGHYRRASVNPLERAAEEVLLWSQLETARSHVSVQGSRSPSSKGRRSLDRRSQDRDDAAQEVDSPGAVGSEAAPATAAAVEPAGLGQVLKESLSLTIPDRSAEDNVDEAGNRLVEIGIPNYIPDDEYCRCDSLSPRPFSPSNFTYRKLLRRKRFP